MALPREATEASKINGLRNRFGKNGFIVLQGFSKVSPKRARASACVRASATSTRISERANVPVWSEKDQAAIVSSLERFRRLNIFQGAFGQKAARSAIEPQWLFPLVRIGKSTQSRRPHRFIHGLEAVSFCQNGDCEQHEGAHPEACRGFE